MKNTKKVLAAVLASVVMMFSFTSCEPLLRAMGLGALIDLGNAIEDYNKCYIENKTGETIVLKLVEDPASITASDDGTKRNAYNKTVTIANGAIDKTVYCGYYKLTIDEVSVTGDKETSTGYELLTAGSMISITKDGDTYSFVTKARPSED